MIAMVEPIIKLVMSIVEMIDEGLGKEEIQKRLSDPNGVAADLLERAKQRHEKGKDFLKREPNA
jgi:hypothetical protein